MMETEEDAQIPAQNSAAIWVLNHFDEVRAIEVATFFEILRKGAGTTRQ